MTNRRGSERLAAAVSFHSGVGQEHGLKPWPRLFSISSPLVGIRLSSKEFSLTDNKAGFLFLDDV